jgi:dCMP deaminase
MLHSHLASLNLTSADRLRPSWDTYFLSLCTLASLRSNCMKRRVGAVLVRKNRVLSTGYNGTPRGLQNCAEGGCSRCNGGAAGGTALDECLGLHAEENALLECGRERGGADGTVLYCNTCPCLRCAVKIVQTGVREVVYQLAYSMDDRSRQIFRDANVLFRQYQPT